MSTAIAEQSQETAKVQLPAIRPPRLPFHPAIEERFGIGKSEWWALVEAVFPLATSIDSVILALSYCKARNLDPFKKNVHIVPIWNGQLKRMVDTIWPGIGELRTTAFRTGQYAGRSETNYGPDVSQKVGRVDVTFPEWAQITVKRLVEGQVVEFTGPRVYWLETYAQAKRDDASPNSMWLRRPRGQLEKCAEAAALRAAFPEELGNEYTNDEAGQMQYSDAIGTTAKAIPATQDAREASDQLADLLEGSSQKGEESGNEHPPETQGDEQPPEESGADAGTADEGAQEEASQASDSDSSRGELLIADGEKSTAYVARLKKEITDAQGLDALSAIMSAAQACFEHFSDDEWKAVERAIEKRQKQLEDAKAGGSLVG